MFNTACSTAMLLLHTALCIQQQLALQTPVCGSMTSSHVAVLPFNTAFCDTGSFKECETRCQAPQ
jgi:hypothetical protein